MSLAGTIGNAVVAAIQGIGLTLADGATLASSNVVRRKTPSLPAGKDPAQIVVVVGETGETERLTATQKLHRWQVAVVIVTAGGAQLADDDTVRTWREQIDAVVYDKQLTTFAGLSGFNYVGATGKSPFDPAALTKDLNYSTLNYEVQTIETLAI